MAERLNIPPPTRVAIGFATVNGVKVPLYIDPEWARYFESLNTAVNVTSAAVTAGAAGAPGAPTMLADSSDGGSVEFIPGPAGKPGADGIAGPALMFSGSEDGSVEFIPGQKGEPGLQGNAGPVVALLASEESSVEFVPGPKGDPGATGTAGAVIALMLEADSPTEMIVRAVNGGNPLTDGDPVTGTDALVRATSPTLATPVLGVASATSITASTGSGVAAGAFTSSGSQHTITITDTGANGGNLQITGNGATTPNKYLRVFNGALQVGNSAYTGVIFALDDSGNMTVPGNFIALSATAIPAGGAAGSGLRVSSVSNFGIFFGSGAPTLSAAQGSLYLRSDGSSTSTRIYVNTNGTTGWTNVTTAT